MFLPGWRADLPADEEAALRVGVAMIPVLSAAARAGTPWREHEEAAAIIDALMERVELLSEHHQRDLRRLTGAPEPTRPRPKTPEAPATEPTPTADVRNASRWKAPRTIGRHPLTGKWVRATRAGVTQDVFVVRVFEDPPSITAWTPNANRSRNLPLAQWELIVIDPPAVPSRS